MGSNRRRYKNKKIKKVQQSLLKDFDLTKKDLFSVWLAYIHNIAKGKSQKETLQKLKVCEDIIENELDYFTAFGLTMITQILSEEI